jgi:glycosidase
MFFIFAQYPLPMPALVFRMMFLVFLLLPGPAFPQSSIQLEPPSWWTGMKEPFLQLMVHGENISSAEPALHYRGVQITGVHRTGNPNYLFIDLMISEKAEPGEVGIVFEDQREVIATGNLPLQAREAGSENRIGFDSRDVIYLLMPDRFSNGNLSNDDVTGMAETAHRENPDGRHGGDLAGIMSHLDYLKDMGVTTLWLNPVPENNMPAFSYHGYAITDFFQVDRRFGGNEAYLELIDACHQIGIKVVMDMVFNHCGSGHRWMDDLPDTNWFHRFTEFTRSNYRGETTMDPYASGSDRELMLTGWFDRTMPDFDQRNPYLANYLIQNSLWWIEATGIDGIRMDTYPYSYPEFMQKWMTRVGAEYPAFSVVGETWLQREAHTAFFQADSLHRYEADTRLPYVTDFPMQYALRDAFTEPEGWTTGLARLYYVLSHDYLYPDPHKILVFADNHDLTRYFTSLKQDLSAWKLAMAFLLTTRGVPMIYYGTEVLMTGEEHMGHGFLRQDFPGGWPSDDRDAFSESGRTGNEQAAFSYLSRLMNWRKSEPVIATGELRHFIPRDGIYVYFRFDIKDTVMVVLNKNNDSRQIEPALYREYLTGQTTGHDVITGSPVDVTKPFAIPARTAMVIEINKPR